MEMNFAPLHVGPELGRLCGVRACLLQGSASACCHFAAPMPVCLLSRFSDCPAPGGRGLGALVSWKVCLFVRTQGCWLALSGFAVGCGKPLYVEGPSAWLPGAQLGEVFDVSLIPCGSRQCLHLKQAIRLRVRPPGGPAPLLIGSLGTDVSAVPCARVQGPCACCHSLGLEKRQICLLRGRGLALAHRSGLQHDVRLLPRIVCEM